MLIIKSILIVRAQPEVGATFAAVLGGGADTPPDSSKTKEDSDKR